MVTDHLLIHRAARELDRILRLRRVRDLGRADDGSIGLDLGGAAGGSLRVLPFGTPPLVWLAVSDALSLDSEPAWLRAAAAVVRGLRVVGVRARRTDRVLRIDLEGRSRFGIADRCALILELVPRFGNVVLLKGETVVAAAKTFSPFENPMRSIEIGGTYVAPPAPTWKIPRLLAGLWSESQAAELEAIADGDAPVHVYRRDGRIVAVHLVPLPQYAELEHTTAARLLDVFAEVAAHARGDGRSGRSQRRRETLLRTLRERSAAIDSQLRSLREREAQAARRDDLRRAGETIYAYLREIPDGAQGFEPSGEPGYFIELDPAQSAKANAARYFERYRKAGASLAHIAKRRVVLERERSELEMLLWETERADADALREISDDLRGEVSRRSRGGRAQPRPTRAHRVVPLELASGARIYVGRSPRENVEVTFRIARPDDLWFHARGIPGAHVVLHPASGAEPSREEIATAAGIAAHNSRAAGSAAVDVDYTARKFVRKQRDGKPGMVWYTNFKTIRVAPDQPLEVRPFR